MKSADTKQREHELIELTGQFCSDKLNREYGGLCSKMIRKLGRKHDVPFRSGKLEIWAASVIHAIGFINFLFDKETNPYISFDAICDYFHVKKSTVSAKSKAVRDILKIWHFSPEFSTAEMKENNPFNNMVMVDGLIVPLSSLPRDVQDMVCMARSEGRDIELYTKA